MSTQRVTLLKECLSVIVVPLLLFIYLGTSNSIIDFLSKNIEKENNLGYISKNEVTLIILMIEVISEH